MTGIWGLYTAKILGNAAGLAFFGVWCMIGLFQKAAPKADLKYWKYALRISLPSIFHTLSDLILMQCDRLMLTSMAGARENAEYSVIYNVGSILIAVYQAVNGAWMPWFYEKAAQKDTGTVQKYQKQYLLLFTIFACGMLTISPELIKLISPRNYWSGIRYAGAVVMASYLIFLYAFFTGYLMFCKEAGRIARNTMAAAIGNLALNYFLIPVYKAKGAVIATVISYLVLFFLHYVSIGREGRRFFSEKTMFLDMVWMAAYVCMVTYIREWWFLRYLVFMVFFTVMMRTKGKQIFEEFM